jgi:multiple antibiotic resistance protein
MFRRGESAFSPLLPLLPLPLFRMLELFISAFITLFVVIDPVGVMPMFAALTQGAERGYRRRMAFKGTLISFVILGFFAITGDGLLNLLHISLEAFRIAGGILLFFVAIDMVLVRSSGLSSTTVRETQEAEHRQDISVFPLAIPLIAGPGAITSMILLTGGGENRWQSVIVVLIVMALVLGLNWILLLLSNRLVKLIGVTGSGVISRVLGILLAALAVQFVLDGVSATFQQLS